MVFREVSAEYNSNRLSLYAQRCHAIMGVKLLLLRWQ